MKRLILGFSFLLFIFTSTANIAEEEKAKLPDFFSESLQMSAHIIGLSDDELSRAFFTINDFQAGKIQLEKLNNLSDEAILAQIDYQKAPYSEIKEERYAILLKRYEIETALLAQRANVNEQKFRQFYRSFDWIVHKGQKMNRFIIQQALTQQNKLSLNTPTSNFNEPVIECDRSCQAINEQNFTHTQYLLDLLRDLEFWELAFGNQPLGTVIRVEDPSTGAYVEVRRQLSSIRWQPIGGSNCGSAACI